MSKQQITYPLAQISHNTDELSIIRSRRAVKRLRMQQDFASYLFKTITITSIVSGILLGVGAIACWRLEINSQPIPTINNRQDWQTRKQICLGWMLFSFSSLIASASLSKKSQHLTALEKSV
ncbi:hypothetical protein [Anabaena azotica]|uniref:Uncharacterized protein n=1 Tax=Anabaena azotica FACHB-119 TaxID=947527 RepID=A0ABR8D636_9NOST|nr:hypothetical protein [Anabaena azotica]MBD2502637.1 hypothetical protein [Anabaena azotica FACHB-119]